MMSLRIKTKVHKPSYFMCVILFWCTTEMLFSMRLESTIGIQTVGTLNTIQSYIVLGLLLIQIVCFQRYQKRDLVRIAICVVVVMVATVCSGFNNQFMSLTLFVIAAKNEKLEDVIRIIYKVSLVMIPIIILLGLTGIIENYTLYRDAMPRYSLGFSHPNYLGRRIYVLVACRFYLRFQKLKWSDYLLAAAAVVFCYIVPNSMTATLLLALLILLTLAYKAAQKVNAERTFLYVLIFFAVASNVVSLVLGSIDLSRYPVLSLLDTSLHGRFSTGYVALKTYGVNLFGHEVYTYKQANDLGLSLNKYIYYLDNSYYNILYRYGLVVYIGFSYFYIYNMVLQTRKKNAILVIFLFIIALYAIEETELYNLATNIFLLSLSDAMYASEFYRVRGGRRRRRTRHRRWDALSSSPMSLSKDGPPER